MAHLARARFSNMNVPGVILVWDLCCTLSPAACYCLLHLPVARCLDFFISATVKSMINHFFFFFYCEPVLYRRYQIKNEYISWASPSFRMHQQCHITGLWGSFTDAAFRRISFEFCCSPLLFLPLRIHLYIRSRVSARLVGSFMSTNIWLALTPCIISSYSRALPHAVSVLYRVKLHYIHTKLGNHDIATFVSSL